MGLIVVVPLLRVIVIVVVVGDEGSCPSSSPSWVVPSCRVLGILLSLMSVPVVGIGTGRGTGVIAVAKLGEEVVRAARATVC